MSKHEIVDRIRQINRGADAAYLLEFSDEQLASYLQRLTLVEGHRGRASAWIRPGDTMAICTRRRAA